ncbi:hypothetical protein LZL87_013587 [Fusarium oxysporum]|nr:hypothetical protein LZL87_013587 [Fusarium oxysporum]
MTLKTKNGLSSHEPKATPPRAGPDNESSGQADQGPEATATTMSHDEQPKEQLSAFKGLGLLDRFLALWIFLAMAMA